MGSRPNSTLLYSTSKMVQQKSARPSNHPAISSLNHNASINYGIGPQWANMASDDEPLFTLGEQCGLHADYPGCGPCWWNVFVISIVTSLVDDDDLIQLAIGNTPDETDMAAMTQQITIRVSTSANSLRPGWIFP